MKTVDKLYLLEVDAKILKEKIKNTKRQLNKGLKLKYKKTFRILDIMLILLIIFNIGALLITNALLFKLNPNANVNFTELNPIAAKNLNVQSYQQKNGNASFYAQYFAFFFHMILWTIIIINYLIIKSQIYSINSLLINFSSFLLLFITIFFDFISDFGYYIGKLIWGG